MDEIACFCGAGCGPCCNHSLGMLGEGGGRGAGSGPHWVHCMVACGEVGRGLTDLTDFIVKCWGPGPGLTGCTVACGEMGRGLTDLTDLILRCWGAGSGPYCEYCSLWKGGAWTDWSDGPNFEVLRGRSTASTVVCEEVGRGLTDLTDLILRCWEAVVLRVL